MINQALQKLFVRDLERMVNEINLYQDESNLWKIENQIKNSGGNLCLHLIGNLKAFIGVGLAQTSYVRDRPFEFAGKNVPRKKLIEEIQETILVVQDGLNQLNDENSKGNFPIQIWDHETEMEFTLIHLYGHMNYHLGQINYHRRLLEEVKPV